MPSDAAAAGQSEIGRFLGQGGFEFEFAAALGQGGFQLDFGGVDGLAGGGLFFFGQAPSCFISAVNLPFEPR